MQDTQKNLYKKLLGSQGELKAQKFLKKQGYKIIGINLKNKRAEVDILAYKKGTYYFCEVKTRVQDFGEETPYGRPASAVNAAKQRHLIAAATTFERRHEREGCFYRFDIIEVYMTPKLKLSAIHHMEDAFMRPSHPYRK